MKYLGVLFVFLIAFTLVVMFTVIAEGDIESILNNTELITHNAEGCQGLHPRFTITGAICYKSMYYFNRV